MNRSQQVDLLETWAEEEQELSGRKGHDYATEDVLANFRRMHKVCVLYGVDPSKRIEDVYLFYILIKLDRIVNLLHSGKSAKNESVQDSLRDMGLYIKLLRMELTERKDDV